MRIKKTETLFLVIVFILFGKSIKANGPGRDLKHNFEVDAGIEYIIHNEFSTILGNTNSGYLGVSCFLADKVSSGLLISLKHDIKNSFYDQSTKKYVNVNGDMKFLTFTGAYYFSRSFWLCPFLTGSFVYYDSSVEFFPVEKEDIPVSSGNDMGWRAGAGLRFYIKHGFYIQTGAEYGFLEMEEKDSDYTRIFLNAGFNGIKFH